MGENYEKVINGFCYMPPALGAWIGKDIPAKPFSGQIPWTPLKKPVSETTFALMTSAGISMKTDPPFDVKGKNESRSGEIPPAAKYPPRPGHQISMSITFMLIPTISNRT